MPPEAEPSPNLTIVAEVAVAQESGCNAVGPVIIRQGGDTMDISIGFHALEPTQVEYFGKYTHDKPIVMSLDTYRDMKKLGLILNKAIVHLAAEYQRYTSIVPLSERDIEILQTCARLPFRVGTYRTDFVIDVGNNIKLIEMTTRQPLNGYFLSGFSRTIGLMKAEALGLQGIIDDYPEFLDYFSKVFAPGDRICVVKGHERLGDFKTYTEIFRKSGYDVKVIELEDLPSALRSLEGATVIEELNHKEIRALPLEIIDFLNEQRIHNDFRNLFHIHDKRFFALLTCKPFLEAALSEEERFHLARFTIHTYTWQQEPAIWEEARHDKDSWILKPILFGKSEGVHAGCLTDVETWDGLFTGGLVHDMVLQPMIEQRRYAGHVDSEPRDDYVAGTLLYFEQEFFGPGIYRASSTKVTNQGDDRKLAQIVADVNKTTDEYHVL